MTDNLQYMTLEKMDRNMEFSIILIVEFLL